MDCAARIVAYHPVFYWERVDEPGRECAREAEPFLVCGIPLCWQHRRAVTVWQDGVERLSPGAHKWFERWAVTPSGPFIPEDEYPDDLAEQTLRAQP